MRVTQLLSPEYIKKSAELTITERLEFLEEYRLLLPLSVFEEHHRRRLEEWYGFDTPPKK